LAWVDAHTRYSVHARDWARHGRDQSYLLRGSDLAAADRWLADQGTHAEKATQEQVEYILASRHAATRRQRILLTAVTTALAISLALTAFALILRSRAIAAEHSARIGQSQALAGQALAVVDEDPASGLRLAIRAATVARTSDAEGALRVALPAFLLRRTLHVP